MVANSFDLFAFAAGFASAVLLALLIRQARKPRVDTHRSLQSAVEIPGDIKPAVLKLRAQGESIAAIKLVRERTGCGLAEAKKAVERLL